MHSGLPCPPCRRHRATGTGDSAGPTRRLEAWPCTERRRGRHRAQRCAGSTHRSRVGGRRRGRHRVQRCAGSTRHSLERGRRRGRHRAQRCAGSTHRSRVGGGGGAAATGFNGGFIGHRDEREKQPSGGMRGERWRFSPAGGGGGTSSRRGGSTAPPSSQRSYFRGAHAPPLSMAPLLALPPEVGGLASHGEIGRFVG